MHALVITAAVLMLASAIQIEHVSIVPLQAQDRVATVLADVRNALGGESKVAGLKALTAEGAFRRAMGGRGMEGTLSLTLVRPDKLRRVEEIAMGGMVGGPTIERTSVLNGTTAWEETATSGMGVGMQMMHGGGDGAPRGGASPTPEQQALREAMHGPESATGAGARVTPEQLNEARVRRMQVQMQRWLAALVAEAPQAWTDAGVAESPEGKADILETKEDTGRVLRLFITQQTHLPLMVQYEDPKPMMMMTNGPGGAGRGPGGPAALGTYAMHLSDYKKIDGVMLPHRVEISLDGQPNEEWTIDKYKVNPAVKADTWQKK